MIKIENVSFTYTKESEKSLKDINLEIADGECILLCGESGCGKTTLTKLINGLIPHFYEDGVLNGNVTVNGISVNDSEMYTISDAVGSVFQNPKSQFFNLDSDAELSFGLENRGTSKNDIISSLKSTIQDLHIENLLHRNVFNMSGGEKQILAYAGVHATSPEVFVLDEPTANLDNNAIHMLHDILLGAKMQGKTVVISEHRLWFLKDIIDRAVYIKGGKIEDICSREEFYSLSDSKRTEMGLRKLNETSLKNIGLEKNGDLSVCNLITGYKKKAVCKDINFKASSGSVLAIVGHNGAGKSTLLRTLCGLQNEIDGAIFYKGKSISRKQRLKSSFLVMQDVNHQLFSDSVWNECELCRKDIEKDEITNILKSFDLYELRDRHPMSLSGGQKQRLAVVTAFLSDKEIVMFDEPTSGLDLLHMKSVSEYIKLLSAEGRIVIVVTHDYELINELNADVYDITSM